MDGISMATTRKRLSIAVAALALTSAMLSPAAASAAPLGFGKPCGWAPSCVLSFTAPSGGVWIDYDAIGGDNTQISWSVARCGGFSTVNAPPETRWCPSASGPVTLTVQGTGAVHQWNIGWH
jgi:hypothetical protein